MALRNVFSSAALICTLLLAQPVASAQSATIAPTNNAVDALEPARAALRVREYAKAITLLTPLAAQGQPAAQRLLGTLYRLGLGTVVDTASAERWLQAAATQNDAVAAYCLAAMFSARVPRDEASATQWLQRAAKAGHPLAIQALKSGSLPLVFQPAHELQDKEVRRAAFFTAATEDDVALLALFDDAALVNATDAFGRTALSHAARSDALHSMNHLLSHGAAVNVSDAYGMTPLMIALAAGHEASALRLLESGATVGTVDRTGNTALMYAAGRGLSAVVTRLLSATTDVQVRNAQGWNALDWALHATPTNTALIAELRSKGLSSNRKAIITATPTLPFPRAANDDLYRGWPDVAIAATRNQPELLATALRDPAPASAMSPLLAAVIADSPANVDKLLAAKLRDSANAEVTALSWAVRHRQLEVVQTLLRGGVDANAHGQLESPPLLDAVRLQQPAIVNELLKAGASAEVSDEGRTALMLASGMNQPVIVTALLNAHANVNARDREGRSALWYAANANAIDALSLLINARATVEQADQAQVTPLATAIAKGHAAATELLLTAGAKATTPSLLTAAAHGNEDIIKRLLATGVRIDGQDRFGNTALITATRAGHLNAVKVLLAAGANRDLRSQDRITAADVAESLGRNDLVTMLKTGT